MNPELDYLINIIRCEDEEYLMATYNFESFVFGASATREPEALAPVFLKKARHGGVVRVGNEFYNARSITGGVYSSTLLNLSNPHIQKNRIIKATDGVLMSSGEIISGDVIIITSCPECFSEDIAVISGTQAQCSQCGERL